MNGVLENGLGHLGLEEGPGRKICGSLSSGSTGGSIEDITEEIDDEHEDALASLESWIMDTEEKVKPLPKSIPKKTIPKETAKDRARKLQGNS